jgi:hypothetical protein
MKCEIAPNNCEDCAYRNCCEIYVSLAAAREKIAQLATEGNDKADLLKEYRLDNAKLRALCAARPRRADYNEEGRYEVALLYWWAKVDAAGRGEGV